MTILKTFKKGKTPLYITQLLIVFLFAILIHFYHVQRNDELEKAVREHAELLGEPLWNYENVLINQFLSILIARKEYQKIVILSPRGDIISEKQAAPLEGFSKFLFDRHLLPIKELSSVITKDEENIGEIIVFWKDISIYYYANSGLVALLLGIIAWLYSSVADSNKTLKKNITDLHGALNEVKKQKEYIEKIYNIVPEGLISVDQNQKPVDWNNSFNRIVATWAEVLGKERQSLHEIFLGRLQEELQQSDKGEYSMEINNNTISISFMSSHISGFENFDRVVSYYDVTDMAHMRRRLSQSEKLESVGRLAAGIAHEINTPLQYVLTNLQFLSEGFEDLAKEINNLGTWSSKSAEKGSTEFASLYSDFIDKTDWEYLESEIPTALQQSAEGMQRIQSIVSAMKLFTYPSGEVAEKCDLNQAIESTVTVARNEWKLIADMDLRLDPELPAVQCFIDQINQVILNMIVNAVHAIEDQLAVTGDSRGKIEISTRAAEEFVEITITDSGIGMSEDVKRKAFDPFYTTKAVNKGTGQGLAIANDIIVNKHGGVINISSTEGKGTTFLIQLAYELKPSVG